MEPKRKVLVSGAVYHNFEESPIYRGVYTGDCKDDDGKIIGFYFVDEEGEETIITNSFAIEKALNTELEGSLVKDMNLPIEITFQGKTIVKKTGKPFNRFQVVLLG